MALGTAGSAAPGRGLDTGTPIKLLDGVPTQVATEAGALQKTGQGREENPTELTQQRKSATFIKYN
jgi:hypothetical protein